MSTLCKSVKKALEEQSLLNLKRTYNLNPKLKCPKCKRKSLFYTNKDGVIFCIRCDEKVTINKKIE